MPHDYLLYVSSSLFGWSLLLVGCVVLYLQYRASRVFRYQTFFLERSKKRERLALDYYALPTGRTMLWKFWVWPLTWFRPNYEYPATAMEKGILYEYEVLLGYSRVPWKMS